MADVDNRKVMTQPEKAEYIISRGCKYFNIDRDDLSPKSGGRSSIASKKKYILMVLSEHTVYNLKELGKLMEYNYVGNVGKLIAGLKDELSGELYGCEKTKRIYNELLSYLNL